MQRVETEVSLQQLTADILVQLQFLQLVWLADAQQLGTYIAQGTFQIILVRGLLVREYTLHEVEIRKIPGIDIIDTKPEKARQVQREEERIICQHGPFTPIQVDKGVFNKGEQVRIGFRLFQTFLQNLHHEQGDGILHHIKKDMPVEIAPAKFFYSLQILQFAVIDHQVQDGGRLKEVGLARSLFGRGPHSIDEIALYTK